MFDRLKLGLHPTSRELFTFAEGLQDEGSSVSARVMRHVARCKQCANEVAAIRATLGCVTKTPVLEPSRALTARILAAGRIERAAKEKRKARFQACFNVAKSVACVAGLAVIGFVSFRIALDGPFSMPQASAAMLAPIQHVAMQSPSPEELRKATSQLRVLASALDTQSNSVRNAMEQRHWRMATALNDDLSAALAALERNPGNQHASRLASLSIQRLADTQKRLYEERSL